MKCSHNLNKEGNTLKILPKRILVHPECVDCLCEKCHKIFRFRKDNNDGKFHKILNKRASKEEK